MSPRLGRVVDLGVLPPASAVPKEYRVTGPDPEDSGFAAADLPAGWTAIRQRANTWWLFHRGEYAGELTRSLVGEWRTCLPGEHLPRPSTYPTPAEAVAGLLRLAPRPTRRPSPYPRSRLRERPAASDPVSPPPRPVLSSYTWQLGRTAPRSPTKPRTHARPADREED